VDFSANCWGNHGRNGLAALVRSLPLSEKVYLYSLYNTVKALDPLPRIISLISILETDKDVFHVINRSYQSQLSIAAVDRYGVMS
jgi:hypothetical protein